MTPFYRRLFLNKPHFHAGAHVIAEVRNSTEINKKTKARWRSVSAELTIADCSRTVTLDFTAYGNDQQYDKELRNVLYKAHTLLHVVNDFVAALEEAIEENDT